MINKEKVIEIGSAICLLEPYFIKYKTEQIGIVIPLNRRNELEWWELAFVHKNVLTPAYPIKYSNQTQVLLSYFFEEFFDILLEEVATSIDFYQPNDLTIIDIRYKNVYIYKYILSIEDQSAHSIFRSIYLLKEWLKTKNLPISDINYLASLKREKDMNFTS